MRRANRWAWVSILSLAAMAAAPGAKGVYVEHWRAAPDSWYTSDEGKKVVANIISWQYPDGGWHKSYDTMSPRPAKVAPQDNGPLAGAADGNGVWDRVSTIDNDATYSELRMLAKAYTLARDEAALASFNKGMAYLLKAQYPEGGWPQRYPLQENYGRYITYNDGAMTGVMRLLRDASSGGAPFAFVSPDDRAKFKASYEKGIYCTLECQIKVNGKPTVWCQQHDPVTHAPAPARAYELPVPCSSESAGVVLFLMEIPNPDEKVRASVEDAVDWFEKHKITGMEYKRLTGPEYENGHDRYLVPNPSAPPIWARFYDAEKDVPLFVDRESKKHYDVKEVPYERRTGYAWYSTEPDKVLEKYPKWKASLK